MVDIALKIAPTILSAAILGVSGYMFRTMRGWLNKERTRDTATKNMLKHLILADCRNYQSRGWLDMREREVLSDMLGSYAALGGNSFIKAEVEYTLGLPHEKR